MHISAPFSFFSPLLKEWPPSVNANLQKSVAFIALAILSGAGIYYLFNYARFNGYFFKDENLENRLKPIVQANLKMPASLDNSSVKEPPNSSRVKTAVQRLEPLDEFKKKDPLTLQDKPLIKPIIPPSDYKASVGKAKALEAYLANPAQCSKMHKFMIFKDIKNIESTHKNELNSLEELMKYLSRSDKISLQNNICIQVVIDALKEFDKEAMARLVEWLIKQPTFDNGLLAHCLQAFHDRHAQQLPINFYALEQLVKFYSRRSWNQIKNERGIAMLPVNHPLIISTMVILIKSEPNNNRIGALVEWMMEQQEYDLTTFTEWVRIFKEREQNNPKVSHNLDYPLLHKILSNFKVKWGQKPMEALHLEASVANYLKGKGII